MSLYLTEKIRIQPNRETQGLLWDVSYSCKNVWNALNNDKIANKTSYYEQKKQLPSMKKSDPGLLNPSSQVLQEAVKELHSCWKSFFELRKAGESGANHPGFRSYKKFFTQKYPQNGVSFVVVGNLLRLAYGKTKKDWIEIPLPNTKSDPSAYKTVTISYDEGAKNWYACFAREVVLPLSREGTQELWFDPGCKTALTGIRSDLTFWEYDINPLRQLVMKHYQRIDTLKSERDVKVKGSNLYRRLNARIKKLYRKINTQTKQYLHVLANKILKEHPDVATFSIGDWDKRKTLADTGYKFSDKRINRQVQNNNPIQKLVGYLSYKSEMLGKKVLKFNERGTTRTCSHDDFVITKGVDPSKRTFQCPKCGFTIERDLNSTLNFLKRFKPAVWHRLDGVKTPISIVRTRLNPWTGKNRPVLKRTVILNYQDACGL
jgi:putative transposase